jgi:murein endopeptidase
MKIEFILILDVWWFNNPASVELRGPPRLRTPIPPSNLQILNTHKEIFMKIEFILILDVWWFNNPASVELRGPPHLITPIPPSNHQILNTHKEFSWKLNLY